MLSDYELNKQAESRLDKERKQQKKEAEATTGYSIEAVSVMLVLIVFGIWHVIQWLLGHEQLLLSQTQTEVLIGILAAIFIFGKTRVWRDYKGHDRDLRMIRLEIKLDALLERQEEIYKAMSDTEMRTRGHL